MFNFREAGINDIPQIRDLTFRVWPQTYASILTPEQVDYMLDMMYSEASLQKQMENGSRFIIIYRDETPVGFAAFFLYKMESIYKLDKIYILPDQQGKGTGQALLNQVIESVTEKGGRSLLLNVNRHNKARGFYEKNGFEIIEEGDFDIGNGYYMNDYIMEKKLGNQ